MLTTAALAQTSHPSAGFRLARRILLSLPDFLMRIPTINYFVWIGPNFGGSIAVKMDFFRCNVANVLNVTKLDYYNTSKSVQPSPFQELRKIRFLAGGRGSHSSHLIIGASE